MKKVKVEVTNKMAVYVDDTRITDRSTKWGVHRIVDKFFCRPDNIFKNLKRKGLGGYISRISEKSILDIQK